MSDTTQEFIEDLQKLHNPYCYKDWYTLIEQSGMKQSSVKMHVTCTGVFRQPIIIYYATLYCYYFGVQCLTIGQYMYNTYVVYNVVIATRWNSQIILK